MMYPTRTKLPKARWGRFSGLLSFIVLAACGGGGSSNGGGGPGPSLDTGVFVDAPVEGLEFAAYDTGGALLESGVTNSAGEFHYSPGGTVTFSLAQGVLELGSAPGAAVVSPADLVDYAGATVSGPHTALRNLLRFLQTLDADGDPTNGIVIPDVPARTASSQFPDGFDIQRFAVPEQTFGSDTAILALVSAVSRHTALVNGTTAAQNFDAYITTVPSYPDPRADWPTPPPPTVVLTSSGHNPVSLPPSATLDWSSTDASSCTGSGRWADTLEPSGQRSVTLTYGRNSFGLTCSGPGGSASTSLMIYVPML